MLVIISIMNKNETPLGKYLQSIRENKKLSLRDVEKAAGISNAYLSQIESGKIKQPSPSILHKLADFYEISYSEVMKLAGYPSLDEITSDSALTNYASRIGPITPDEESALVEYLAFLRSRGKRRGE